MRLLHVGWGFTPWRVGGLIDYAEGVMEAQARAGHAVGYFCAGRYYPMIARPRLHRWTRRGVRVHEVLNAPLTVGGTHHPERELSEPALEELFARVLGSFQPELVHVHELAGLPSSVIDLAQDAGVPVAYTLHDYFALCPTFKLFDADARLCKRTAPGAMCQVCCSATPEDTSRQRKQTIEFELRRLVARIGPARRAARAVRALVRRRRAATAAAAPLAPEEVAVQEPPRRPLPASAEAYQRRRDVNVERLGRVDALIAISSRVEEIQRELGVSVARTRVQHLTLGHFDGLAVRRMERVPGRVHFATLNGASTVAKGADVLGAALDALDLRGLGEAYRLTVLGDVADRLRPALERRPAVCLHGVYDASELDFLLADVDVGVVPSAWEETYGYVGVECLAKGIPVIGNARGGITDYTRPGVTGWLNRSATGEELAAIMADVIARPEQILPLHASVVEHRAEFVKPFAAHLAELEVLYRDVVGSRA